MSELDRVGITVPGEYLAELEGKLDPGAMFEFVKHGDQEHQDWLHEAFEAYVAGKPKPEPRGLGRHDALIAELESRLLASEQERARLDALINSPHVNNFLEAVRTEAAHQQERWGSDHDSGKADSDWFWLVGYLSGKALFAANFVTMHGGDVGALGKVAGEQRQKALHHIITTAAALLNWHSAKTGADTRMRPGIDVLSSGGKISNG